jgi:hypothetical protein
MISNTTELRVENDTSRVSTRWRVLATPEASP